MIYTVISSTPLSRRMRIKGRADTSLKRYPPHFRNFGDACTALYIPRSPPRDLMAKQPNLQVHEHMLRAGKRLEWTIRNRLKCRNRHTVSAWLFVAHNAFPNQRISPQILRAQRPNLQVHEHAPRAGNRLESTICNRPKCRKPCQPSNI